jgi:hypothetical protein
MPKASYDALAKEVMAQWQDVKDTGLKVDQFRRVSRVSLPTQNRSVGPTLSVRRLS